MERKAKDVANDDSNDDADGDDVDGDNVFLTMRKFRKRESDRKLTHRLCSAAQEVVSSGFESLCTEFPPI